jgi:hypothetical protein
LFISSVKRNRDSLAGTKLFGDHFAVFRPVLHRVGCWPVYTADLL